MASFNRDVSTAQSILIEKNTDELLGILNNFNTVLPDQLNDIFEKIEYLGPNQMKATFTKDMPLQEAAVYVSDIKQQDKGVKATITVSSFKSPTGEIVDGAVFGKYFKGDVVFNKSGEHTLIELVAASVAQLGKKPDLPLLEFALFIFANFDRLNPVKE